MKEIAKAVKNLQAICSDLSQQCFKLKNKVLKTNRNQNLTTHKKAREFKTIFKSMKSSTLMTNLLLTINQQMSYFQTLKMELAAHL